MGGLIRCAGATTGEGVKESSRDSDGKASPPCGRGCVCSGGNCGSGNAKAELRGTHSQAELGNDIGLMGALLPFVLRVVAGARGVRGIGGFFHRLGSGHAAPCHLRRDGTRGVGFCFFFGGCSGVGGGLFHTLRSVHTLRIAGGPAGRGGLIFLAWRLRPPAPGAKRLHFLSAIIPAEERIQRLAVKLQIASPQVLEQSAARKRAGGVQHTEGVVLIHAGAHPPADCIPPRRPPKHPAQ